MLSRRGGNATRNVRSSSAGSDFPVAQWTNVAATAMAGRDDDVASEASVASEVRNLGVEETIMFVDQPGQRSQRRRGRPSFQTMVKDGAPTVAVIVGKRGCRWTAELECGAGPCVALADRVGALLNESADASMASDGDDVKGLVVIRKWHFVETTASHRDTYDLMSASSALHRKRSGQRFLEHEVLASARLQPECRSAIQIPDYLNSLPAVSAGRLLLASMVSIDASLTVTKGEGCGRNLAPAALLQRWADAYAVSGREVVNWPLAPPLASLMVLGEWYGDVSVRFKRAEASETCMAPTIPSNGVLLFFLGQPRCHGYPLPPASVDSVAIDDGEAPVYRSPKGFIKKRYSVEHLIACVEVAANVRNVAKLRKTLVSSLKWWFPKTWRDKLKSKEASQRKLPHRSTLYAAVVRVDMAAMLARRAWYAANGPTYRHIAFDASPQQGQEFFVTVERVIKRSAMASVASWRDRPEVQTRTLPLTTLGKSRMGLAEKTQALIHQIWLEYGPSASDVRAANLDVRVCLSDMGTELGICDAKDVVSECLRHDFDEGQRCQRGQRGEDLQVVPFGCNAEARMLFPLAIVVPGPQHIVDNVVEHGVESLLWWGDWEAEAKIVSQWLKPINNRRWLKERVQRIGGDRAQARLASLDKGCDSFAHWRWKTLGNVTRDLTRMEDAVRSCIAKVSKASELGTRCARSANAFWSAARDPVFWERTKRLKRLIQPLKEFASWLRGCDCHEQERMQGKSVACQWQGCRAASLASRVDETMRQLDHTRSASASENLLDDAIAATQMLASFKEKIAFVHQEPYTLWQARDRDVVAKLIEKRDSMVSNGDQPHRVTEYFVGKVVGSWRDEMQAYADGGEIDQKLLRELMSYQLARIDDTWAEATHRDATTLGKRAAGGKVPYIGASLRKWQTLASLESMSTVERKYFNSAMANVRALAQRSSVKAKRLIQTRQGTLRSVASMVYRFDNAALQNWTAEIGEHKLKLLPPQPALQRDAVLKLQSEYIDKCFPVNAMLSFPRRSDLPANQGASEHGQHGQLVGAQQQGANARQPDSAKRFFIILDKRPSRKKFLRTSAWRQQQSMGYPASVQWVAVVDEDGQRGQLTVRYDGAPEVVDLLQVAKWAALRSELSKWKMSAGAIGGLLLISDRQLINATTGEWNDENTPTLALLDSLASDGWLRGVAPKVHNSASAKRFFVKDPVRERAYLQCLAGLPHFLGEFNMDGLRSDQRTSYYKALLCADRPSVVPLDASEPVYLSILKAAGQRDQPDGLVEPERQDRDSSDEAEGVVLYNVKAVGPAKRPKAKSKASRSTKRRKERDWTSLLCPGLEQGEQPLHLDDNPMVASVADAIRAQQAQASSSSSSGQRGEQTLARSGAGAADVDRIKLRGQQEPPAASSAGAASSSGQPGQLQRPALLSKHLDVTYIENVKVTYEKHGVRGLPRSYERLRAKCTNALHAGCRVQRSFSARFAAASGLGDLEPYAFIGAWLSQHGQHAGRKEHEGYKPSPDQVLAYAKQCQWVSR